MTPHVAAIVNPRSGNGRTGRTWRLISKALTRELGPIKAYFTASSATTYYLPAAELARVALHEGAQLIIAVGGDGTINEVMNGFFDGHTPINQEAHLAIVNVGTSGDFHKTFGIPDDIEHAIQLIGSGNARRIDLGRLSFISERGDETIRYFGNIASFGLSGAVGRAVNRATILDLFGGRFAFLWSTLKVGLAYRPQPIRLTSDTGFDEIVNVGTGVVANGRYFGSGVLIAPQAIPDDELFDIIIRHDTPFRDLLQGARAIYHGKHLANPKVTYFRARTLTATPIKRCKVLLDIDGEVPGRLPARFDILPRAIMLRC